jgi:DNA-binding CsgD family transcriptional regulator
MVAGLPSMLSLFLFPVLVCVATGILMSIGRHTAPLEVLRPQQAKDEEGRGVPLRDLSANLQHESRLLNIVRLIRDPLLCVAAIMFAVAITRTVTLDSAANTDLVNIVGSVGTLLGAAAFYVVFYVLGSARGTPKSFNLSRFYRVVFPVLATVLLLLPIFGDQLSLLVSSLVYVGYKLSFVLILPTCMTLARQGGAPPLTTFGVFMGGVNLVLAVATGFAMMLYRANYFGAATLAVGILLALYVLTMTYSVVMNVWRRREQEEKVGHVLAEDDSPSGDTFDRRLFGTPDALADASLSETAAKASGPAVGSTLAAVQAIAAEHLLTEREREVLLLLAQGRNVPTIARQLIISENTVRTHTKNIYTKLDIHGKQELLNRIEEYH